MALKPRSKLKPGSKKQWRWPFNLAQLGHSYKGLGHLTQLQRRVVSLFVGIIVLLYFFSNPFSLRSVSRRPYPPVHGYYTNELQASSPLIFPHIEHAHVLKEIGIRGLYTVRTDVEGESSYVLKPDDKPLSDDEKKKTTDQILLVKKSFLDHGKLVYRKDTKFPEIVIVTLIDFENSDLETIVQVVQNRADYAQKHNYGMYVRWIQEFVPLLQNQNLQASHEYVKPLIMRAAIHAFPQAKYLFFVDQDSLIMKLGLSLEQHLLDPKILDMALLRNVPVTVGSNIKTYTHFQVDNTRIIIPQSPQGELDLTSFVVSTDLYGKAFLEFIADPIYINYSWENFAGSVAHMLQWHPQMMGKTALVVQKLIAAPYDASNNQNDESQQDAFHYTEGDLIVSLRGCRLRGSCASDISSFYSKVKKN